ncbi:MAG TPA: DUF1634 domain-containing protein [Candidatus Limnocylindrales bacterium]
MRATAARGAGDHGRGAERDLERAVGRILMTATYVGVGLIAAGAILMVLEGVSPLDPAPSLSPADAAAALVALRPEGPLAVGLVVLIASPTLRVVSSLVGYLEARERRMALVSLAILAVIAASVVLATGQAA